MILVYIKSSKLAANSDIYVHMNSLIQYTYVKRQFVETIFFFRTLHQYNDN